MTTRRSCPTGRHRIGHLHLALLLAAVGGCARAAAPRPSVAQPASEPPQAPADEPATQARDGSDLPPPWWTPLPAVSLDASSDDERHEQLDDRPAAIAAYADLLARYPAREDARALGQRAICLAASLDDMQTVEELLSRLAELYGRRGFVVPPPQALVQLCAGLPAKRP